MSCRFLCWLSAVLSAIGAINWGLVAFLNFNLVTWIDQLASGYNIDRIIYAIVALAGIYTLIASFNHLFTK